MTDEEARLLDDFRKLNQEGQASLVKLADYYAASKLYRIEQELTDAEKAEGIIDRLYEVSKLRFLRESGKESELAMFANELTRLREQMETDMQEWQRKYDKSIKDINTCLAKFDKLAGLVDDDGDRQIFGLYYFNGWTDQQIADRLNLSRECVNHRRKKMAEIVERDIDDIIR